MQGVRERADPAGEHPLTRRLALGAALAATAGLAGCAIGGSDEPDEPGEPGEPGGPARPGDGGEGGGDAEPGGGPGAGPTGAGQGSATGPAQALIALADVPVGGAASVSIDGRPAIVARPAARTVTAHSARCTHRGCTVFVQGPILQCPCHGSQFDALTGAVVRGPATLPLPEVPVHLAGDEVVAG